MTWKRIAFAAIFGLVFAITLPLAFETTAFLSSLGDSLFSLLGAVCFVGSIALALYYVIIWARIIPTGDQQYVTRLQFSGVFWASIIILTASMLPELSDFNLGFSVLGSFVLFTASIHADTVVYGLKPQEQE